MSGVPGSNNLEGGAIPLSPLPVGGRRHGSKKLRLVKKKTVRRMLKKMGLKMRGGNPVGTGDDSGNGTLTQGGRRRKHTKKAHRRRSSRRLFGIRY